MTEITVIGKNKQPVVLESEDNEYILVRVKKEGALIDTLTTWADNCDWYLTSTEVSVSMIGATPCITLTGCIREKPHPRAV